MVEKTIGKKTASKTAQLKLKADGGSALSEMQSSESANGKKPAANDQIEKVYYCIDCGREIHHKGRCLPCNATARRRLDAQDKKYE